jgi:pyridoxine 4-dehydrogenase
VQPYPADLLIATRGGCVPGTPTDGNGAFVPNGRREHLRRACEDSLRRLRVECIDLYQLHVPDPEVPYADSVGTLVELRDEGKIAHIGLSDIGRRHPATALELTPIASVQNRFDHADRTSAQVLEACEESGIAFLPWAPVQTGQTAALAQVATDVGATPQQIALAWLLQRSPVMLCRYRAPRRRPTSRRRQRAASPASAGRNIGSTMPPA